MDLFGSCEECNQKNTGFDWCKACNAKHFQQNFENWTSGNVDIDNLIRECQLKATNCTQIVEWIPYNKLRNVCYLTKGGFSEIYVAEWIDGQIFKRDNNGLHRSNNMRVILKKLENVESANQS